MKKIVFLIFFFWLWIVNCHSYIKVFSWSELTLWEFGITFTSPYGSWDIISDTTLHYFCNNKQWSYISHTNATSSTIWNPYSFSVNGYYELTWRSQPFYTVASVTCNITDTVTYSQSEIDEMVDALNTQILTWSGTTSQTNNTIIENGTTKEIFSQQFLIDFYKWQLVIIILILAIKYFEIFSFWKKFNFFK